MGLRLDRLPYEPMAGSGWYGGFAASANDRENWFVVSGWMIASDNDGCGCAVTGNVCPGGIDHMGQVRVLRVEVLDQVSTELSLHERVGDELADISRSVVVIVAGEG